MTPANRRLLFGCLLASAGTASAWLPAPAPVSLLLGLPLALFLPGFAWLRAASPGLPASAERIVLAAGLSLALCVLTGLALNAAGRLDPRGWAGALGGFTILGCAVAAFRRAAPAAPATFRITVLQAAMFALALGVAAVGVRYAAFAFEARDEFKFTQFWMTPRSEADRGLVTIGVRNDEARPMTYAVSVVAEGSSVGRWPAVDLAPGQTWTTDFAISGALRNRRVEAWLRRADAPAEIYRKVWIAPVAATAQR